MFESLNRDSRSETGDPEKASDRIGAQSVQSENDAHQDIETAVRSVVNRLPPPIEQKHPASMPPVPGQGAARSSLAVRSLTRASERADKLVDELQIVRSSIPPVHRRRLRRNRMFFNIAAAAMIIFAFIVTVMLTAVFRDQSENLVTVVPQQQMETAIVANRPDIAEVAPSEQEDAETSAMVFSVDEIAAGLPASNENPVSELTSVQPSFTSEQATKSEEMEDAGNYTRTGEARRKAPTVKKESTSTVGDPTPLPKSPSRESVERAMTRISRQVEKCRLDQTGRMVVEITFAGATGEVTDARILGQEFQGTDVGRCVLQAVRAARVSSFQNATEVIKYPFAL